MLLVLTSGWRQAGKTQYHLLDPVNRILRHIRFRIAILGRPYHSMILAVVVQACQWGATYAWESAS